MIGGMNGYSDSVRDARGREDGELGGYSHVPIRAASGEKAGEVLERSGAVSPYRVLADARLVPLAALPLLVQEPAAIETLPYVTAPNSIEGIICSFEWPQGCQYWIGVALCESSLRPTARGYGGWYVGLFQVWLGHSYASDWLTDPYNNTLAAWELSKEGTVTSPWPVCRYQ